MDPKPPPPSSLLLPWQEWVVVPAENWIQVAGKYPCFFNLGDHRCRQPSIIMGAHNDILTREGLCVEHMGTHLWVGDDGVLYQWRADPPFINRKQKPYERKKRTYGKV